MYKSDVIASPEKNAKHLSKKLEEEKRALEDVWVFSKDHRTVKFWNKTDEWIELTGSFSSQFGPSSIKCVTKICLWPRECYAWRFMGINAICLYFKLMKT